MRRRLVVGNWKMNGSKHMCQTTVPALARAANAEVTMVVCPPAAYITTITQLAIGSPLACGAQNVSSFDNGAYTGELSTAILRDLGCAYAIVGHSERRSYFHETDKSVAAKALKCVQANITPSFVWVK